MVEIIDGNTAKVLKCANDAAKDDRIPQGNRKILEEYLGTKQNRSEYTLMFYAYRLREFALFCKKPFKEVTRADISAFLEQKCGRKTRTKNGYIASFKAFFRWLYKMPPHQFPECVVWLEKSKVQPAIMTRQELITKDEFKQLLNATTEPHVRAYLVMSLEGLYRRDEVRRMRIKDIVVNTKYLIAHSYEKKTGKYNLKPLVFSKPYVLEWLNNHPFKDDVESPLFVPMCPHPKKKFLSRQVFNRWTTKLRNAVNLQKRFTPHRLRHVRTTMMLLSGVDKDMVQSLGGWTSPQMLDSTYAHIEKEDRANSILSTYGIETDDDGAGDIEVGKCMVCGHPVSELEEYCRNCKNVPTLEQAEREQKKLMLHQKEERDEMQELKERMTKMEKFMQEKLVEEVIRAVIKQNNQKE